MFKERYPATWIFHKNTERTKTTLLTIDANKIPEAPFKEYADRIAIDLPAPTAIDKKFDIVLKDRKSCRTFSGNALPLQFLSDILYYGYGIKQKSILNNVEFLERFVPSGGGLYSLELYLILQNVENINSGVYHYFALSHSLELIREIKLPSALITHLFLDQPYVAEAGAFVIACSVLNRCMQKYEDRGYRYIMFEAGHVFQNINLCASALEVGALNMGGFYDNEIAALLQLDMDDEVPLYAMALGNYPSSLDIRGI